ncbi:MAG TPA: hemolysin family protein [Gemmatimonadales bacterium]|nr:hemolysin family protein [Gemmatimonadales bacterium]
MSDLSWQSVLARLGVVALLVLANAFFVAAEYALVASRRTRLEAMIRRGDAKAKLARRALLALDKSISGTQLGITLASLGLGWVGEPAIARTLEGLFAALPSPLALLATHGAAVTIAFLLITFLDIVLGELAPKALALLYPERTSRWLSGPLIVFTTATNPFIWLLRGSANLVLRIFGLRAPTTLERLHSAEELRMLVDQSAKAGKLDRDDARLLAGVFEFSEKTAREVMTPRTEIVALDLDASLGEAADLIARARRSRYPVMRASLDDIAGIVHAKDVLAALRAAAGEQPAQLASLVRPVHFVPGSREIEDVLADMKLMRVHMVIVLDEFGGTAGLVTMEDLLEEIVGQIYDEYDRPGQQRPSGTALPPGAALPGNLTLDEVNARCGLTLVSADYTTLGGYLFGKLGRLPKTGDRVAVDGGAFEITAMDGRRVAEAKYVKG